MLRPVATYEPVLDVETVTCNDLFSAGSTVPFHVTWSGTYRGGLGDDLAARIGDPATMNVVGIARLRDGEVHHVDAITTRLQVASALTGVDPFAA